MNSFLSEKEYIHVFNHTFQSYISITMVVSYISVYEADTRNELNRVKLLASFIRIQRIDIKVPWKDISRKFY